MVSAVSLVVLCTLNEYIGTGAVSRAVHMGLRCPHHALPRVLAQVVAQGQRRRASYRSAIGVDRPT